MTSTLLDQLRATSPIMRDVIDKCGTREQAASVAGVSRKTIFNWLGGKSEPSFTQGIALCRHAGIDPSTVCTPHEIAHGSR